MERVTNSYAVFPLHLKALQHLMHVIHFLTHPVGCSVNVNKGR